MLFFLQFLRYIIQSIPSNKHTKLFQLEARCPCCLYFPSKRPHMISKIIFVKGFLGIPNKPERTSIQSCGISVCRELSSTRGSPWESFLLSDKRVVNYAMARLLDDQALTNDRGAIVGKTSKTHSLTWILQNRTRQWMFVKVSRSWNKIVKL